MLDNPGDGDGDVQGDPAEPIHQGEGAQGADTMVTESVTDPVTEIVTDDATLLGTSAEAMPAVDPDAIANAGNTAPNNPEPEIVAGTPVKGQTDSQGFPPDPATHMRDANGEWILSKAGFIRRRVGGAAKKRQIEAGASRVTPKPARVNGHPAAPVVKVLTAAEKEAKLDMAAKGATNCVAVTSMVFYGQDDGQLKRDPKNNVDEPGMWYGAWKDYFRANEIYDFPPWMALTMCCMMHVTARMETEGHKKRVSGFSNKIKGWFADRKAAKYKRNLEKDKAEKVDK